MAETICRRRAKVARCSHGVIYSAHAYTVGDEASEREADRWVAEFLLPGDATADVGVATVVFGGCKECHVGLGEDE